MLHWLRDAGMSGFNPLSAQSWTSIRQVIANALLGKAKVYWQLICKPSSVTAFSRSFDVFLELRKRITERIEALLFPTLLSKYQNECPCCANKQPGEEELDYAMLFCMDGNESLKRHQRVRRRYDTQGKETIEDTTRPDSRKRESFLYLEQDYVDRYKNEVRHRNAKVCLTPHF